MASGSRAKWEDMSTNQKIEHQKQKEIDKLTEEAKQASSNGETVENFNKHILRRKAAEKDFMEYNK